MRADFVPSLLYLPDDFFPAFDIFTQQEKRRFDIVFVKQVHNGAGQSVAWAVVKGENNCSGANGLVFQDSPCIASVDKRDAHINKCS